MHLPHEGHALQQIARVKRHSARMLGPDRSRHKIGQPVHRSRNGRVAIFRLPLGADDNGFVLDRDRKHWIALVGHPDGQVAFSCHDFAIAPAVRIVQERVELIDQFFVFVARLSAFNRSTTASCQDFTPLQAIVITPTRSLLLTRVVRFAGLGTARHC